MRDRTRPVTLDDAADIARLQTENRAFLAPWDAVRPDAYYTVAGQQVELQRAIDRRAEGTAAASVVLDDAGEVVGLIRLNGITRGAFQSCSMGYWVAEAANGRGYASQAVGEMLVLAFAELRLHRVQAETLRHNTRSQRVLLRNGFEHIGMAPRYVRIAAEWRDHDLFQLLND